jgi:hypothetical protein
MYILSIHFLISGYESCHNICVMEWKKVSTVKSTGATKASHSRKSRKDRQYNDQKEKEKMTNNDLHNTKRKLKIEQHEPH